MTRLTDTLPGEKKQRENGGTWPYSLPELLRMSPSIEVSFVFFNCSSTAVVCVCVAPVNF